MATRLFPPATRSTSAKSSSGPTFTITGPPTLPSAIRWITSSKKSWMGRSAQSTTAEWTAKCNHEKGVGEDLTADVENACKSFKVRIEKVIASEGKMTSLNKNSRRQSNEDEILGRRKSTSTSSISNLVSLNIIYQQGETALLPCDISVPNDTRSIDQLVLIMWYREDVGSPIYSIDARTGMHIPSLSDSQNHWIDTSHFGENRVVFDTSPNPRKAKLKIFNVTESDDGLYRCRVDFKISQTRTSRLNLTVIDFKHGLTLAEVLEELEKNLNSEDSEVDNEFFVDIIPP
nr:uncharacterized protein LOC121113887 [Lepeophtheirus salmonis]